MPSILKLNPRRVTFKEAASPLGTNSPAVFTITNTASETPYLFKIKTTAPMRYLVKPTSGTLHPQESVEIKVAYYPIGGNPGDDRIQVISMPQDPDPDVLPWQSEETVTKQKMRVVFPDIPIPPEPTPSPVVESPRIVETPQIDIPTATGSPAMLLSTEPPTQTPVVALAKNTPEEPIKTPLPTPETPQVIQAITPASPSSHVSSSASNAKLTTEQQQSSPPTPIQHKKEDDFQSRIQQLEILLAQKENTVTKLNAELVQLRVKQSNNLSPETSSAGFTLSWKIVVGILLLALIIEWFLIR